MSLPAKRDLSTSVAIVSSEDIKKLPGRISVERSAAGMVVTYRWFNPTFLFFIVVALLPIVITAIGSPTGNPWALARGIGFMTAMMSPVFYLASAFVFNKTRLLPSAHGLSIRRGPLPWPGKRELGKREIVQLFVAEREPNEMSVGRTKITFDVVAETTGGKDVVLVKDLESAEQGLTIERLLEEALNIEDRPVLNETASKTARS